MTKDCCVRNYKYMDATLAGPKFMQRIEILKKFIGNLNSSIDIGCGAYTPVILKTTHACDHAEIAGKYLKELDYKGDFRKADVKNLIYKDKEFKVAVCSEVIEHLRTEKQVVKAFKEIDRISDKWLVTTPRPVCYDKDHTFFFTSDHLFDLIPFDLSYYVILTKGIYFYISNDKDRIIKIIGVKNG